MKTPIPNKLKELRMKAHLTQSELANKLEFNDSQNRMSKWEKGIATPNIQNLFKLCRFYGVAPSEIYPDI